MNEENEYEANLSNPVWATKAILLYAPEPWMRVAIFTLIDYIVENKELSAFTMLDILAQVSATGDYIPSEGYEGQLENQVITEAFNEILRNSLGKEEDEEEGE